MGMGGRVDGRQRLVLLVSILASFVAFLDGAIVNVALPAIQHDLGGGLSAQQWIVDAYLLTLGSFILIAGSLSDLLGRKRILTLGLLSFGIASLLCALAPNSGLLIASRAVQGVAGALLVPSSLALIISNFSGPAQGKAVGSWTAWTGISFILGPLIGGILVDQASWRWIFAINILPIAITLYLMSHLKMAKDIKINTKIDFIGATLCALGLGGPVFALIEQSRYGWSSPLIYLPLVMGLVFFASFLIYESGTKTPMLPLSLFKNHNFSIGNIATLAVYAGLSASTFLLVLFLQQVFQYPALSAGLALLPITIIMFFLSSRFGALAGKYGPRLFMGIGPLVAALGFLLMTVLIPSTQVYHLNYWTQLLPEILIFGLGLSMTVAPLTSAILGDVPQSQAGIASAVNNAVARVAGLIAVAAVGAIVATQFSSSLTRLNDGYYTAIELEKHKETTLQVWPSDDAINTGILSQASVEAFRSGILTIAGLLAAGGVISLAGIQNHTKKPRL